MTLAPDPDMHPIRTAGRMTKKQRKQTLTEELLSDAALQAAHKRRFNKLQVGFIFISSLYFHSLLRPASACLEM